MRGLEVELEQSQDTMADLDLCMEDCEATLAEKGEYITHLEEKLARSTLHHSAWKGSYRASRCG